MKPLAPEADISSRDKWLHPAVYYWMQLLIPAWYLLLLIYALIMDSTKLLLDINKIHKIHFMLYSNDLACRGCSLFASFVATCKFKHTRKLRNINTGFISIPSWKTEPACLQVLQFTGLLYIRTIERTIELIHDKVITLFNALVSNTITDNNTLNVHVFCLCCVCLSSLGHMFLLRIFNCRFLISPGYISSAVFNTEALPIV